MKIAILSRNRNLYSTKRLVEAGYIIGIDLVDHLIIGDHSYCSMKEKGLIPSYPKL